MLYNVKTIQYADSTHVRVYGRPVKIQNRIATPKQKQPVKTEITKRTQEQINHSINSSVNRTVNQIYSITRSNHWDYFITLTINPKKLDNTDFAGQPC